MKDQNIPYRLSGEKDLHAYSTMSVKNISKLTSPYTALISDEFDNSILHAMLNETPKNAFSYIYNTYVKPYNNKNNIAAYMFNSYYAYAFNNIPKLLGYLNIPIYKSKMIAYDESPYYLNVPGLNDNYKTDLQYLKDIGFPTPLVDIFF